MRVLTGQPRRFGDHDNAFGFLRLLLASLVIVAHTPDLVDGDAHRELVIRTIGGGLTFGGLAVGGFFIISGFLITASYLNSRTWASYLLKRVARIYPAFAVMFVLCLFVVRPLAGRPANPGLPLGRLHQLVLLLRLQPPDASGAFATLHYPALNGAAWTISYEFKCYLLVLVLGGAGLLTRKPVILGCALACLLLNAMAPDSWFAHLASLPRADLWLGMPREFFRMVGLFFAGASFYLLRGHISLRWQLVAVSAAGLLACLMISPLANLGLATFGSYLIFASAQGGAGTKLGAINDATDVSYGLYLYAWPVEQLLLLWFGGSSLLLLGGATWLIAMLLGWISWKAVERPVMLMVRPRKPQMRGGATMHQQIIAPLGEPAPEPIGIVGPIGDQTLGRAHRVE